MRPPRGEECVRNGEERRNNDRLSALKSPQGGPRAVGAPFDAVTNRKADDPWSYAKLSRFTKALLCLPTKDRLDAEYVLERPLFNRVQYDAN